MRLDERLASSFLKFVMNRGVKLQAKDGRELSEAEAKELVKDFVAARQKE
jgi:hypothetical protein